MKETKVLVIGAGIAGRKLVKEIHANKKSGYKILGILDDDPQKIGKKIVSIPILGTIKDLAEQITSLHVEKVLIALPSVDGEIIEKILKRCLELQVPCQIIPRYGEIIEGTVDIKSIRDVKIEDLLERPVRMHDFSDIPQLIRNKTIFVSGAAGSIGSELCRQIAAYNPQKIVLYDWWENGLYHMGLEFKESFPNVPVVLAVGSVQDPVRLTKILSVHNPSVVFHAAAYKHVPLMEENVLEAIKNNIFGTLNLVTAAKNASVKKVVFISTDKAVNPSSIMGTTKLIGEMIMTSTISDSKTRCICVRFGNVLNSAGSVLPLFKKQLPTGTITVTDKKMTRFFMTISEAVQLILKATVLGEGNEIFVLDMGKPVKIVDMARKFILLSGLIPEKDVMIKFIGLRPGEKLKEELSTKTEKVDKTKFEKIFVLKKRPVDNEKLELLLTELQRCVEEYNEVKAKKLLKTFIAS